jgi:hypothetical protein
MEQWSINRGTWWIFPKAQVSGLATLSSLFFLCSYNIQVLNHIQHHHHHRPLIFRTQLRVFNMHLHSFQCILTQFLILIMIELLWNILISARRPSRKFRTNQDQDGN